MPCLLPIEPGTEYIEYGFIPYLTSQALLPILPDEPDDGSVCARQWHRARTFDEHKQALDLAERNRLITPLDPITRVPSWLCFGEYGPKRIVSIDQVREFAEPLGISVTVKAQAAPTRPVKESIKVQRAHAIVVGLRELGYDPLAIPPWSYTEGKAKSAVRQWFKSHPLDYSDKTFDHAWDEARRRELICEADPGKS